MTSNIKIPKILKANDMSEGIKSLVGKKMTKEAQFMGTKIKITKLSVSEVLDIQAKAKDATTDDSVGFELVKTVIKMAAEGASELSNEEFDQFPMDELSKLSNEIMAFSGLGDAKGK